MSFSQNLGKAANKGLGILSALFSGRCPTHAMVPTCQAATPGDSGQPEASIRFCPHGPHIFTLPSCPSFLSFCVLSYLRTPPLSLLHVASYAFPSSGSDNSVLPAPDLQLAVYPHPSLIQTPKAPNRQGTHLILAMLDTPQHRRDNLQCH